MWIFKVSELMNLCKKSQKFVKLLSYKNFFLNVNRRGTFLIWVRLKIRKAELKQWVKVNLAKYVCTFLRDCRYNIFFFTNTKPHIFLIPKNQNIPKTPLMFLNFNFFVEGLSNLNCLQFKLISNLNCLQEILETRIRSKFVRSRTQCMKLKSHLVAFKNLAYRLF